MNPTVQRVERDRTGSKLAEGQETSTSKPASREDFVK